ncbi:membrane protein [Streptomyces aureocirculatus]|uniref:membrane protein n=1 Tax=Streptomyces aureocirculatus TaxID=67275 RepID=UPI0004CB40D1|nr:membrane protein [Streptomyces aureocirculatus]
MTATPHGPLRHVLIHLVTPLLMCLGMGLAYMSAFVTPEPHDLPVAVVGTDARAHAFARSVADGAGDALDVRTLGSRAEAVDALKSLDISGAYVPDAKSPELLVASAGSDMSALATEKAFTPVAAAQGMPLKITDVAAPVDDDPTGQGLFFLLVAVSIGSYASVAALGAAGAGLRMRTRAALAAGVSFAVSLIGAALAGPVFHLAHHGLAGVWAMAWLYSAGILFIGLGLHTFLKRWTTLAMMVLFVMLNFTSSGGLFRPELQNGFYGSLHSFWNGAGFVEGVRGHLYFAGHDLARSVWTLLAWLTAGLVLTAVAALTERRRAAVDTPGDAVEEETDEAGEEEEMEESVGV